MLWQFVAQFLAQLVVEIGERLVEQHQVGALGDGPCERRALLLAAGELERGAVADRASAGSAPPLADALRSSRPAGGAGDPQRRGDVLVDRQVRGS